MQTHTLTHILGVLCSPSSFEGSGIHTRSSAPVSGNFPMKRNLKAMRSLSNPVQMPALCYGGELAPSHKSLHLEMVSPLKTMEDARHQGRA